MTAFDFNNFFSFDPQNSNLDLKKKCLQNPQLWLNKKGTCAIKLNMSNKGTHIQGNTFFLAVE